MRLPSMQYVKRNRMATQVQFGGMNHTQGARDGEIWDMENMCTDHYPVLASRLPRYKIGTLAQPGGLVALDKLGWVDGSGFYYDGQKVAEVTPGKKHFCTMGKRILILPDKLVFNTEDGTITGMGSKWEGTGAVFQDGKLYDENAKANAIRAEGVNWGDYFKEGDAVTITGCTAEPKNNKTPIIREIAGDTMHFYENTFTLKGEEPVTETGTITIERTVPDMIAMTENENRLWGTDGKTVYASKPGDPTNWNVFDGLESDSWTVMPESPGRFSGAVSYKGFPQLFKEDKIYKVYGSYPSNFQLLSSATMGVEPGSGDSLAVAGETLFWLGLNGVVAYSGGIPTLISKKLGERRFRNAVAGSNGVKYYISMEDENGQWGMYVFDTRCSQWSREDDTHAVQFARIGMDLYWLNDKGEIWLNGDAANVPEGAQMEESVEFWAQFAPFTDNSTYNNVTTGRSMYRRSVKRLHIRASHPIGIRIRLDGQEWTGWGGTKGQSGLVESIQNQNAYASIGIGAVRQYEIRIEGTRYCSPETDNQVKILEITREYYQQSHVKNQE